MDQKTDATSDDPPSASPSAKFRAEQAASPPEFPLAMDQHQTDAHSPATRARAPGRN
jgi:hypothetical protein